MRCAECKTCIDQIAFMESLVEPSRLRDRLSLWAREEIESGTLERKADQVLTTILYRASFREARYQRYSPQVSGLPGG